MPIWIARILTGGATPPFLMGAGVFFLCYLRLRPFRNGKRMFSALFGRRGSVRSSRRALFLSLAGTLGVGNIVGVANAVAVGGAGAVFWMWVSALLAMVLKYAEIVLGVSHRRYSTERGFFGGAVYYIKDRLGKGTLGTALPILFGVLLLCDAVTTGCAVQIGAVARAMEDGFGVPPLICGLAAGTVSLPLLCGGGRDIPILTEKLVPLMSVGYAILCAAVLILRRDALPEAIASIFRGAFTSDGGIGGIVGVLTSKCVRAGTMRGLLSNEAGCGTAPTAHAAADAESPAAQGVFGIAEVFVDTILLCTATALVILVGAPTAGDGAVAVAFEKILGAPAVGFFSVAVLCFGYATVLCKGSYGLQVLSFFCGERRGTVGYRIGKVLCLAALTAGILWGAVGEPDFVWTAADLSMTGMVTINLAVLLLCRREIKKETERFVSVSE